MTYRNRLPPSTAILNSTAAGELRQFFAARESTAGRFIRGTFWAVTGTVSSQGLGLVASIITARLLGRVGYGEFGMVTNTVLTFGIFAGLGVGLTATKYVAELRGTDRDRTGRILGLCLELAAISGAAMSAAVFLLADTLAAKALNAASLAPELRLAGALLFLGTVCGAQNGALAGLESFKTIAQVNLTRGLVNFPLAVAGTWAFGLYGAVAASVAGSFAGLVAGQVGLHARCRREGISIRYRRCLRELPIIWKFSLPAFLNELILGPAMWLGSAILVHYPAGYGELGLLNVAQQWRRILLFLPSVFASVTLPILSAEQHAGKDRFTGVLDMAQSLSIVTVVPAATLIMCLGGFIVRLYGREFGAAAPVLLGIVAGATISAIGSASGPGIRARGRMWFETLQNATWGGVYVVFASAFCPRWGALALSGGFVLACLIHSVWSFLYLYRTGDVTAAMLSRIAGAVAFVLASATLTLWADRSSTWITAPLVPVSVVLSVALWLPAQLRDTTVAGLREMAAPLYRKLLSVRVGKGDCGTT